MTASTPAATRSAAARASNRLLLRRTMDRAGFAPYDNEWWHFTLRNERYPDRYFDFPVEVSDADT